MVDQGFPVFHHHAENKKGPDYGQEYHIMGNHPAFTDHLEKFQKHHEKCSGHIYDEKHMKCPDKRSKCHHVLSSLVIYRITISTMMCVLSIKYYCTIKSIFSKLFFIYPVIFADNALTHEEGFSRHTPVFIKNPRLFH